MIYYYDGAKICIPGYVAYNYKGIKAILAVSSATQIQHTCFVLDK